MNVYKKQKVGGESIKYLHYGSGNPILFLHGFSYKPHFYRPFLNRLSENFEIIAPAIAGINYLEKQPTSIDSYASLTSEFVDSLKLESHYLVGHSMGSGIGMKYATGSSAIEKFVGMCPLTPISKDPLTYALTGWKLFQASLKFISKSSSKKNSDALEEIIKDLPSTYILMFDLLNFSYENIRIEEPSLLLYASEDNFSMEDARKAGVRNSFKTLRSKLLKDRNHNWPINSPEEAEKEVKEFLNFMV